MGGTVDVDQAHYPRTLQNFQFSPPVCVSSSEVSGRTIYVVREDVLPGGTKQRAAAHYVAQSMAKGNSHFVYASPFCGYAQVALAFVCRELKVPCSIFAERVPTSIDGNSLHPYSALASSWGATVYAADSLNEAQAEAEEFAKRSPGACLVPLGFNSDVFKRQMREELIREWGNVLCRLPEPPKVLWLPVGSGTLASIFSDFVGPGTRLHCVNVHVLAESDSRIEALRRNPRVTLFSSSQAFAERASERPNIPSNVHYDAKVWSFIRDHGEEGDVWWNVGP
jgi:1-aminocyclopropane-1-carboxylate deaminase/D-cysteine desulfhydrase-like pyridoxal-dependent ACC family enzyme